MVIPVHDFSSIKEHGGTIKIHSEGEGKGTTFTVELPAVEKSH